MGRICVRPVLVLDPGGPEGMKTNPTQALAAFLYVQAV
jgi:hypothetical protein